MQYTHAPDQEKLRDTSHHFTSLRLPLSNDPRRLALSPHLDVDSFVHGIASAGGCAAASCASCWSMAAVRGPTLEMST